jgi:hypothetical protein
MEIAAPAYPQHGLDAPELDSVRAALRQVLDGHEPYPGVVVDRWWDMQDANSAIAMLVDGCAPEPSSTAAADGQGHRGPATGGRERAAARCSGQIGWSFDHPHADLVGDLGTAS